MAPKDENELQHMILTAIEHDGPVAIRYPRGNGVGVPLDQSFRKLPLGRGEILRHGRDGAIFAIGTMVYPALAAAETLAEEGVDLTVVNARFVKPLDRELLVAMASSVGHVFTVEENALQGGFGTAVMELFEEEGVESGRITRFGFPDRYLEQGEQPDLRAACGLDAPGIVAGIRQILGK
jgi:1-deoxy-D-xylulose-5-phosphate synthase